MFHDNVKGLYRALITIGMQPKSELNMLGNKQRRTDTCDHEEPVPKKFTSNRNLMIMS